MFWFYEAVGAYLGGVLGVESQIVQSEYDPLADPVMLQDKLDIALFVVCLLCSLTASFPVNSRL
jgi:hypothetical protein